MATRRQPTQRLLAGRNAANPIEMSSNFNLSPSDPQSVAGVARAARPSGTIGDSSLAVLDGMAEWGSKKIREAAKTRYETLAMEGAIAYQQGKSVDDLPMDGNKWMLEGYRVMDAETTAAALFAAQQEEITMSLHESDPDAFRARYTERFNAAIAGKDERTQDIIKTRMAEQMPSLVAQHTRENARYQEGKNYDSLTSSIDVISRDPHNSDKLIEFALGGAGSEGLSTERRQSAVIDGVIRAYANGNPLAYSVLEQQGVFDNLTADEASRLQSAQTGYEARTRATYDETRFNEERALMDRIELGELTPEESVAAWAEFTTRHGLTMGSAEAGMVADVSAGSNEAHTKAVNYEIETAKIKGDFGTVADLSYTYAKKAGEPTSYFDWSKHRTQGGARADGISGLEPTFRTNLEGLIASAPPEIRDGLAVFSGYRSVERQKELWEASDKSGKMVAAPGRSNHNHGGAADLEWNGERLDKAPAEVREWVHANAAAFGLNFRMSYEPWHIELSKGATVVEPAKLSAGITVDPEQWTTLVDYYKGDLELAAVALTTSTAKADEWNTGGRLQDSLPKDTAAFVSRMTGGITGQRYVTAQTRLGIAQEAYTITKEAAAIDVYAIIQPQLSALDDKYKTGGMSTDEYMGQSAALRDQWGIAQTKADVDQTIELGRIRQQTLDAERDAMLAQIQSERDAMLAQIQSGDITTTVLEPNPAMQKQAEEDYAKRVDLFSMDREAADMALQDAVAEITSATKPEGVTDEAFLRAQNDAIIMAQNGHQQQVNAAASAYDIEWKDSKLVETAKKGIQQVRDGLDKALQNTQDNAIMERAVATGTLDKQSKTIQDRAYAAAMGTNRANTERFASTPNKDGKLPTADEVAAFEQVGMEDWFAKANYVPEQMRNEFSAVLNGRLVGPDGVVSQHALDSISAYATLKQKSVTAADKLLDPQAKIVAEAALNTAGTPQGLPRVLLDMWAEGLDTPFTRKPSPDFMERSDVQAAIYNAVTPGWFSSTPLADLNLDTESVGMLTTMMEAQIKRLHTLNPNLNPKYMTKMAEDAVLRSAVPVMQQGYGLLGSAPGESIYGLFEGQNTLLIDPTGGNIYEQMFGGEATTYAEDRTSVSKAINGYLSSDTFKGLHGDMTPSIGAGEWLYEALPFTNNDLRKSAKYGTPIFNTQHVGNGNLYIDFTLDGDGTTRSLVLPMDEIGTWYKDSVRADLTK